MRVLVLGGGAREDAIADALVRSEAEIFVASTNTNPGLERKARVSARIDILDADAVLAFARRCRAELAVIGPEAPLARGVSDALRAAEIPTVGPSKSAAEIEWSKRFCREFLERHRLGPQPRFQVLTRLDEVDRALAGFPQPFVVKPSGLTAGKGVRVQGVDFTTAEEGAIYAKSLLIQGDSVVLEERLEGEEFSQMAFVTDSGVYPMPAVQDFKRALEGDRGGNTGGMGSYSQRDHLLPFLRPSDREKAIDLLQRTAAALAEEGRPYRGILYGGFMQTARGPVLVEFNSRFGDPEGINVLSLYEEGDFDHLLSGVAHGRVDPTLVRFRLRASVVKYVVPPGYGDRPRPGGILTLDLPAIEAEGVHVYYGSVDDLGAGRIRLGSGRGAALVGEASAIAEASARVEASLKHIQGDFYVRHDIATKENLSAKVEHMRRLLAPSAKSSPLPLSVAPPDAPASSAARADQVL
jgi:phosphoribosylamine--glycine ligase